MISIRKAATELERLEELRRVTSECYRLAIRSTAQYAVEIGPALAEGFRRHLENIHDQLRDANSPEEMQQLQASFRGELRAYRDQSQEQLARLRDELRSAAAAMQNFANSVTAAGDDHEQELKGELEDLEAAAHGDSLDKIRKQISESTSAISTSVDQMRRSNQLVVAQLCDEIRLLHKEIESGKRIMSVDPTLGVWNRQKMDSRIEDLLRQNQPFCLLQVCVRNLKRLEAEHSRAMIDAGLKALLQRLAALVGPEKMTGRWSDDEFVAILEMDPAGSIPLSRTAARKLTGTYTVQDKGAARTIALQASAGIIDCGPDTSRDSFDQKVAQLTGRLTGA